MIKHKALTSEKHALLSDCPDYGEMGDHHLAACHCSLRLNESIIIHLKKWDRGMCHSLFVNIGNEWQTTHMT
jgi:hypothetical protein